MNRFAQRTLALAAVLGVAGLAAAFSPPADAATPPLRFGMDAGAVDALTNAGLKPDYAMMWAGVWLEKYGWAGFDYQLDKLYRVGVTPVIQFYYWGDDISRSCLEYGCWSPIHQAHKNKEGWHRLASSLATHINDHLKGRAVVIVVESEFNKKDAATYETLDGYLADKAAYFKGRYWAARIVLGFGNWGSANWWIFDRAASKSDEVGIQGMRASTRDSLTFYQSVVPSLVDGSRKLNSLFGKKVFITDLALSSYWEPDWLTHQKSVIQNFMAKRSELKGAGVSSIMYRSLYDSSGASTKNYYGEAERHFGLAWSHNRAWKPAMNAFADGIRAERSSSSVPTSSTNLVEGERFGQKPVGGWKSLSSASGDAVWNLWSNGYMAQSITTGPSYYGLRVRAGGSAYAGVGPLMAVEVDGREVSRVSVRAGTYQDYWSTVSLASGTHLIKVRFLNDAMGGGEDRNLYVDVFSWVPKSGP